jgi:hypothetical protein
LEHVFKQPNKQSTYSAWVPSPRHSDKNRLCQPLKQGLCRHTDYPLLEGYCLLGRDALQPLDIYGRYGGICCLNIKSRRGSMLLRNIGKPTQDYTASHPWGHHLYSHHREKYRSHKFIHCLFEVPLTTVNLHLYSQSSS